MRLPPLLAMVRRLAACGALVCAPATPAQGLATATAPTGVASVVAGILAYTRWPVEAGTLRLCTIGRGPTVDELMGPVELGTPERRVAVQPLGGIARVQGSCDAVYVTGLDGEQVRELLKTLAGQPVLLLGDGAGFCSDGGMFCLEPKDGVARFGANLDAIARSGLRVNPLVLRIARAGRS